MRRQHPQIQLELPRTKALRAVVERMNRMDKYMFLDASMEGTLVLRVQTEEATVKTFYTNLVPRFGASVLRICCGAATSLRH